MPEKETGETAKSRDASVCELFQWADSLDAVLMSIGLVLALINGAALPGMAVLLGSMIDNIAGNQDELLEDVGFLSGLFGIVCAATFVASYAETTLFMIAANNQTMRIREDYLRALLRYPAEYYDTHPAEAVAGTMAEDTIQIRNGIGSKLGQGIHNGTSFFIGIAAGFYFNWKMALLVFGTLPLAIIGGGLVEWSRGALEREASDAYARAGQVATQAISAIRTVAAFGREKTELQRYSNQLQGAEDAGIKKQMYFGMGQGTFFFMFCVTFGVTYWFGGWLVVQDRQNNSEACRQPLPPIDECMTSGTATRVLFSVIIGIFSLAQIAPNIAGFSTAKAKVGMVIELMERRPEINTDSESGNKVGLDRVRGALSFKDVTFAYPSRPEHKVLDKFSLEIQPGETVALVGGSGSGKSTALQLLQRLYDPQSGQVQLDGQDIRSLNVNSYRRVLGVVQQEPALFMASIGENIKFGRSSADNADEIPQSEVEHASKVAVAHDFITQLKQGYDSYVGEGGSTVSGGQKQRIAIARSVIRAPRVFLDDESTSALDTHSEKMLQESFASMRRDAREQGRPFTQVIVAHRLSTVKGADKIVVMEHGRIVQQGTHEELMQEHDGEYYRLYRATAVDSISESDSDIEHGADKSGSDISRGDAAAGGAAGSTTPDDADSGAASASTALVHVSTTESSAHHTGKGSPGRVAPADMQSDGTSSEIQKATTKRDASDDEVIPDDEFDQQLRKEEEKLPDPGTWRVWEYSRDDWPILLLGLACAAFNGAVFPLIGYGFGDLVQVLYKDDDTLESESLTYMSVFLAVGVVSIFAQLGQFWAFGVVGERMTRRLRVDYFEAILRCEAGFFDERKNSTGRLAARLSGDCASIRATLGEKYALYVQTLFSMVIGVALAFSRSWRITLLVIALAPALAVAGMLEEQANKDGSDGTGSEYESSGDVAGEAVANIRTVHAFSMHGSILNLFRKAGDAAMGPLRVRAWTAGFSYGVSQCAQFAVFAVVFYVGAIFVRDGHIVIGDLLAAMFTLMWGAFGAGAAASQGTDASHAEAAKRSIFSLIDRVKPIDPLDQEGIVLNPAEVRGEVELRGVSLAYPTRPNEWVLKDVNLTLKAGSVNALVGPSGSGKSTIVKLLLKQYLPQKGKVLFDGMDVQTINTASLRAALGFVQQEPVLLPGTVGSSIAYGMPAGDDGKAAGRPRGAGDATDGDAMGTSSSELVAWRQAKAPRGVLPAVRDACRLANADEFVENLRTMPEGYSTEVGSASGSKVSGGQKQRICIARALVRKPKLLIFDEATSALDSRSQEVVMRTIEELTTKAKQGRVGFTTVQIAHRLATVASSDQIVVMDEGRVVDAGTHDELLGRCELYGKLWRLSGNSADDE